ncbi:MAG: molybdopterin molybdenumtransferase MoeA, partial [Actinobacteria bacterium]|nr:molybdopterin molybdenumtransferase MoeA [Actinomycetota bacterium]
MTDLLTLEAAIETVLARSAPLPGEPVALEQAAGRVLAEPALARVDLPPFASSAMDGFALRSVETPGRFPVVARIAAGSPASRALRPGEAMGIATGGVVPEGADAVVPIERVVQQDNRVEIQYTVGHNDNIRPRGGDAHEGDVVLEVGSRLGAAQIGALAAAGVPELVCVRRPRVAVLATGSELRTPGETLEPG